MIVNINGAISAAADAKIPAMDHGFLFGDSVYETLRTYRGRMFLFSRHYERLAHSAGAIRLRLPDDAARLRAAVERTLDAAQHPAESRIRIVVTRGVGGLAASPADCGPPNTVIFAAPLAPLSPEVYSRGIEVTISSVRRYHAPAAEAKTGNLLGQVLASEEAQAARAFEAILLTPDGALSDGISSNIYLVRGGVLYTPSSEAGIVHGITRGVVLDLARQLGLDVREALLDPDEIGKAEEMFLTSTTREVVPIVRVDGKAVGGGKPGAVTLRLLDAYRQAIERLLDED